MLFVWILGDGFRITEKLVRTDSTLPHPRQWLCLGKTQWRSSTVYPLNQIYKRKTFNNQIKAIEVVSNYLYGFCTVPAAFQQIKPYTNKNDKGSSGHGPIFKVILQRNRTAKMQAKPRGK